VDKNDETLEGEAEDNNEKVSEKEDERSLKTEDISTSEAS
jgi:hypothetical protein